MTPLERILHAKRQEVEHRKAAEDLESLKEILEGMFDETGTYSTQNSSSSRNTGAARPQQPGSARGGGSSGGARPQPSGGSSRGGSGGR